MKLYIPSIGDIIVLTKDWEFNLYDEYRNDTLYILSGGTPKINQYRQFERSGSMKVTLKKDTVMSINRIYIRKGKKELDSVSFVVKQSPSFPPRTKIRFWAKLEDVNNIEFELLKP